MIMKLYSITVLIDRGSSNSYIIFLPKGVTPRAIILKCWSPKGIPTIVMQNSSPQIKCKTAISHQPRRIQIRFIIVERQPGCFLELTITLSNGHIA